MTMRLTVTGFFFAMLFAACGGSNNGSDEAGAGTGGSGGDAGSSHDAAGDGPTTSGGQTNAAGSPTSNNGGSNPGSSGIIQALDAALGNSAIAVQTPDTFVFWPEAATDENDEWLVTILGTYDGTVDNGAVRGHYRATEPTKSSLDFELEAAISSGPYTAFIGPSWLSVALRQAGATGFRVEVTCSDVKVDATGTGAAGVYIAHDTDDEVNNRVFCAAAAGPEPQPFSQPSTSFEVEADSDGYAVMPYFKVTAVVATLAQGETASAKTKVHMEFTALP
jgi:hypothetical protein